MNEFLRRFAVLPAATFLVVSAHSAVVLQDLPEPGLQPQTFVGADGTVHLIYLVGNPAAADIQYRHRAVGAESWSVPIRVNSGPTNAMAVGTVRGARLAVGGGGQVHVIWNGTRAEPPKTLYDAMGLFYSRLSAEGRSFEPERDLSTSTHQLDGGGAITADAGGRVFIFWNAAPESKSGETNRAIFLAVSTDQGKTFAAERNVSPSLVGACSCCGMSAFANPEGNLFVLFRDALRVTQRDMMLLTSSDHGLRFTERFSDPWPIGGCPMSTAAFSQSGTTTWASWETDGIVYRCGFDARTFRQLGRPVAVSAKGGKHPFLVSNSKGQTLQVWTEGTGWQKGGTYSWELLDASGRPTAERGKRNGIPAWSFATAYALPNGDFVVLH